MNKMLLTEERMENAKNGWQGKYKRVLCVCSAGLLRSPTTAWVLGQEPYVFNTRACGCMPIHALICIDEVLVHWADEIVVMEDWQEEGLRAMFEECGLKHKPIKCLGITDSFEYRDPRLVELIRERYNSFKDKPEVFIPEWEYKTCDAGFGEWKKGEESDGETAPTHGEIKDEGVE